MTVTIIQEYTFYLTEIGSSESINLKYRGKIRDIAVCLANKTMKPQEGCRWGC